jgi:hypothetical protein
MSPQTYVNMPQNDRSQIEQIKQEYESTPAMGLVHGVQKDAIQNGIGARINKSVLKACQKDWQFNFEIVEINGKSALTFWDEGTSGLTGKILSSSDIEIESEDDGLGANHSEEKLSRFLSRFNSGGNTGPGSFGRGKLIFQAASVDQSLLIDSFRNDDGRYIALDRFIEGNQLKQPDRPYVDSEAKKLINDKTSGMLSPLEKHGTRVTILNVDADIVNAFKLSFSDQESADSLYHMISETWWEIIEMGAQINLIQNERVLTVKLTGDLERIVKAEDNVDGFRVFRKENVLVMCQGFRYKIKELKLVVSPNEVPSHFNEIWVQRKQMKIGGIQRGIRLHGKIANRLAGFLRLDSNLEDEFESAEGTTHYSFNHKKAALKEVREILKNELEQFQKQLGFKPENTEGKLKNELNNALTELNEMATELGLPTEFAQGKRVPKISVSIKSLVLPNEGTTRVDLGQEIGPIEYQISNISATPLVGTLIVSFEQGSTINKEVFSQSEIIVGASGTQSIKVGKIVVENGEYSNQSMMLIKAKFVKKGSTDLYAQVSRSIWLGIDPPARTSYLCDLKLHRLNFPREDTTRVELGELIKDLAFTISNNENTNLKLNIDIKIRKARTTGSDVTDLVTLMQERDYEISALSDYKCELSDIEVSRDIFGVIFDELAVAESRKCEIFYSVRHAETDEGLKLIKGDHACSKKSQEFYCGVDPAGQSIFKQTETVNDEADCRRAFTRGSSSDGYSFILNTSHPSYKFVKEYEAEVREAYMQEQMIYHACKLAVKDEVFEGPLSSFEEKFLDTELPHYEVAESFDEVVGMILKKVRA